jgi:hypothetical protein
VRKNFDEEDGNIKVKERGFAYVWYRRGNFRILKE